MASKYLAEMLVKGMEPRSGEEDNPEAGDSHQADEEVNRNGALEMHEGHYTAASDIQNAMKAGDHKALAEALHNFMEMCK